jgi:DNA repair protein RecO (recombination protein O)
MANEEFEVDGLVIREVKTGEADKILTVLTGKHGKITVNAKGTVSLRSRFASSAQIFTYSTFLLTKR